MRRNLPRGAKIFLILNEINRVNGMRYSDVIKFAYELTYGKNTFDPIYNRGYYSGAFVKAGSGMFGPVQNGPMTNYTTKDKNDGKYYMDSMGTAYLEKNWNKFSKYIGNTKGLDYNPKKSEKVTNKGTTSLPKSQVEYSATITLNTSNAFENPKPHGFKLDEVVGYQHIQKDGQYGVGKIIKIVSYSSDMKLPNEIGIRNHLGDFFYLKYKGDKFINHMGFECKLIKFE